MMRRTWRLLLAAVLTVLVATPAAQAAGRDRDPVKTPTAVGEGGAAATVDVLGTQAAVDTLERGGNAVDAAVAAAGVLGVTEPFSAGIGGGGFMVIRDPRGRVTTIDDRETAPAAMRPDSFFENGAPLPFNDARYSGLSAGVPGTVATWHEALDRYGSTSLRRLLAPAIDVAARGFTVDQTFFDQIQANVDLLRRRPGDRRDLPRRRRHAARRRHPLRNPDMARAYERIADRGPHGFYRRRDRRRDRRRGAQTRRSPTTPTTCGGPA